MNGKALAVIIAAIVLVVGGVVAAVALTAGDDDDSASDDNGGGGSKESSVEEFCTSYTDYTKSFLEMDFEASEDEQVQSMVDAIKDFAADVEDQGAPEGMPDQARDGMDVLLDWVDDLDAGDFSSMEEFESFQDEFSDEENAAAEAFFTYAEETCGGAASDLPTDVPTDLPSDFPTDFPTELPSDFPTEFPTDLPTDFMSDFPTDFLTEIPSEYLTLLPSDYLSYFPTE